MNTFVALDELESSLDARTQEILRHRRVKAPQSRGWLVRRALCAADLIGLSLAFAAAQTIYAAHVASGGALTRAEEFAAFAVSLPFWIVGARLYGLYDKDEEQTDHSTADDFTRLFHLITVCTFLLYAASKATRWFNPEFGKLLLFWLIAIGVCAGLRSAARGICRRQIDYLQNAIILGAGSVGQSFARKLLNHPEYGINLVGFVDAQPKVRNDDLQHLTLLGGLDDLPDLVRLLDVDRVIVAFSNDPYDELITSVQSLRKVGTQIDIIPRLFESLGPSVGLHMLEGVPLVSLPPLRPPPSSLAIKRALDLAVAAMGLVLLVPIFVVVAVGVRLDSAGPVLYRHKRVGRGGKEFYLFKFRTMRLEWCRGDAYGGSEAEAEFHRLMTDDSRREEFALTYKLQDDPRVTRVGRLLRKASLDELPQLLNVISGDLSLVGPRALTSDELDRYYGKFAEELLLMRPGITGYWQINGRSRLAYADRVRLDLAYMRGWSLGLDVSILARTLRVIFGRKDAA